MGKDPHGEVLMRNSRDPQENPSVSSAALPTTSIPRRPLLRTAAGVGIFSLLGVPALGYPVRAALPGVGIDYRSCHVVFVTNATAIETLAVYYADSEGERQARYDNRPNDDRPPGVHPPGRRV